ncbi:MAG: serine/threonine-protein kinase [Tychonema bourrellyi B0820]|uniref:Serine/threonine-protein kinase B n=1 Tax=Tychonema bourrellyi FEM_GT703 TaxID=2040638 RepID=A0A2G4EZ07_9CYAN|nr:serine/threonine-protein kinase [Tychonema bourrellyi]MDQ2098924.1 serine/threonine-protein kinase [Tychonema bourrellyi B0820]PHX54708.1 serine/threonine protein kinase [Tychonema bourrellyi FEM_GT703]
MSYCVNPGCPHPQNPPDSIVQCQACGARLLLRDRYQVIQPLGQGGFGATFLAKDISLPGQPSCVVKQLRPSGSSPRVLEMARELFKREAKTLGKLGDHPQVPRLLDYFEVEQQFYLVQEYVKGSTLKQEVKQQGRLNESDVKNFLLEILPVVQYIHSQGVIHRDIKPANIIRRVQDNHLVLIDFGAVKDQVSQTILSDPADQSANTKFSVGTFSFAPPEQMAMRPIYASDIYALGMTCLYLLTAKSPKDLDFDGITGEIIWQHHVQLSPNFSRILEKMLKPIVSHRFQSATDVVRALNGQFEDPSLLDGLATQFNGGNTTVEEPTIFNDEGSSLSSPQSKINQGIKPSRTSRSSFIVGGNTGTGPRVSRTLAESGRTFGLVANTSSNTVGSKQPKVTSKWDGNSVRSAYFKGKRDFADCELSGLQLQKAQLAGGNFYEAKLVKANLQAADLSGANLGHARLIEANLRDANLTEAYCSTANFEGADLRGADLTGAYLSKANLRGANLSGANLTNATVSEEQLAMAKTNWMTIKPDGKRGFRF